jgi:hypothetical protein
VLFKRALVTVLILGGTAQAYETKTHRWITRQAAARLVAAYPGQYDELLEYLDDAAFGSEDEDHFLNDGDSDLMTLRVMRHFFRATDGQGLTYGDRLFPNSYEWGYVPNETNAWDWGDGMRRWRARDKAGAYQNLGHVVHLIQDLTVPAHTHLDEHGPPAGEDYERWAGHQVISETDADLPLPLADAVIPSFDDPYQIWVATAAASYYRNLYPGDLSNTDEAAGIIAQMYPDLSFSWLGQSWAIPEVGDLGSDFLQVTPGRFYFKQTDAVALVDRVGFDPASPETMSFGTNVGGEPMVALLGRDLIPVAVLHSAALMKLYLDAAHAQVLDPVVEPPVVDMPEDAAGCAVGGRASSLAPYLLFALAALFLRRKS